MTYNEIRAIHGENVPGQIVLDLVDRLERMERAINSMLNKINKEES